MKEMSVFRYLDYKAFLRDWIAAQPRKGYGEASRWARHLGVNTTLISQILRGPKDFTFEQAQDLAGHLGLMKLENEYFLNLVLLGRAGTAKARAHWKGKLEELRQQSKETRHRVAHDGVVAESDRSEFYSSWHYSAIRLSCEIPGLDSVEALSHRFNLPRERVSAILDFLISRGFCLRREPTRSSEARFQIGPSRTFLEKDSPHLARHHLNWRLKAMQSADSVAPQELMLTSPMSLSRADFQTVREELLSTFNAILSRVVDSQPETLACLNMDWLEID